MCGWVGKWVGRWVVGQISGQRQTIPTAQSRVANKKSHPELKLTVNAVIIKQSFKRRWRVTEYLCPPAVAMQN